MAKVTLRNVSKRWGAFIGVDNQSLVVEDKEFFVLLGPSGCGKTTLMRMISGLEMPTDGDIEFDGQRVNDELAKDRDVAMVFQNYGLYPHMTVHGNIAYPLKVRGTPKGEIESRVQEAARQVEMLDFLDRKPRALSGGQRQRVALARAIVRKPRVFLMDEPLSNLDAKLRVSMRAELKHLSNALKITTIYVTHDQVEAMTLADRVAVMKKGVIQQLGPPTEIFDDPANLFVAGFIGSPAMNLINGSVRNGRFITMGGTSTVAVNTPDRERVVLGVRAEDILVHEEGGGDLNVSVYAYENTGENVMLTLQFGQQRVTARTDRGLRKKQDEKVGLSFNPDRLYLFDADTEERIRT
ncbi:ABC transporter ATP-binding protein [Shimia sediminis]|uniref:ABC transporter ATP-binding protein n=1 Tax=Shimia sediminis TaxID=2497945 RepID=UPI000F8ECDDF|nr:sn-glycerol-3-phosphate ABC transporter ATP-binding protein UgpC [Shimia sediminis]